MSIFNNILDLGYKGYVERKDKAIIKIDGITRCFEVTESYILCETHTEAYTRNLANRAGYHSMAAAMQAVYGYDVSTGVWPCFKVGDMAAAYRCLQWLFILEDKVTVSYVDPSIPEFNVGDEVCMLTDENTKGRVLRVDGNSIYCAWQAGATLVMRKDQLRNLTKEKDISLTKQKQTYNEYLQKQDLPRQGGERTTSSIGSGGGREIPAGRGHHGYEAHFEDCVPKIRSYKISGTPGKF